MATTSTPTSAKSVAKTPAAAVEQASASTDRTAEQPEAVFRNGRVRVSLWPDASATEDKVRYTYKCQVTRVYKVKGKTQSSHVLYPTDMLAAAICLQQASIYAEQQIRIAYSEDRDASAEPAGETE